MNKATKFTLYLSLYVVLLCSAGMATTYLNDALQSSGFFGDRPPRQWKSYNDYYKTYRMEKEDTGAIDTDYVWGARHYWYFWMCFILFALSVVRVIIWANDYWEEKK